jgi:serpin B
MRKFALAAFILMTCMVIISCRSKRSAGDNSAASSDTLTTMNSFSFDFYRRLSTAAKQENISFSPASLRMVMAVAYSGARGSTLEQMSNLLGFDTDHDVFHPHYHDYFSAMLELASDTLVDFRLANKLYVERSAGVLPSFEKDVHQWHEGAFEKVDFIHDAPAVEAEINSWVEQMTQQRITGLIPRGSLTDLTRLVLVNALYVKSAWKYPFDKSNTTQKDFTTTTGSVKKTDFMIQQKKNIKWYESEKFTVIELPYTSAEFSLLLIRPNVDQVKDISFYIPGAAMYQAIMDSLRPQEVYMEIPSFKIESQFSLGAELRKAGMEHAFDDRADFSGINGEKDLRVSNVFQKVFFEMDEEGTEAAAATGMVMVTTSMPIDPPQPKEFIANRPFLFILKENRFHSPLFIGQYVK